MKKIQLVHVLSNLSTGGAQVLLFDLIEHLQAMGGYEQSVIAFKGGGYHEKFSSLGIPVHIIKPTFFLYDPIFIYRFIQTLLDQKPDCIHSVLWAANFLSRSASYWYSIPLVQSLHNNLDQNGKIRSFLDRISSFHRTQIVAVSDGIARSLVTHAPWLKKSPLVVIKNGIEVKQIRKNAQTHAVPRSALGLGDAHFVIGSVGRFEAVKNYALLLTTFALLYDTHSEARLVLVGYGSQENFLKKRAFDLGIADRVVFVIQQPGYAYYHLFDCFVLSSYGEGISMALLEAMSLGCPAVVTSPDVVHDVITHEQNGLLVPLADAQLLAGAIDRYIKDKNFASHCGQQGLKTVQEFFTSFAMAEKYAYLYQRVVSRSAKN